VGRRSLFLWQRRGRQADWWLCAPRDGGQVGTDVQCVKLPTNYTYTGQYSDSYINLLWYGSRHYDPEIGRFIQPDSIVPSATQGVQAYDRFAYVSNNPLRYTDPTGHCPLCLTAVIGGAIGGIVGAVGYTAYVAASGHEWNATHFWAATGGGALAGALIGTGIGIAEGLTVAGATTAAVEAGTAVEGANLACGGDLCASEVQDASQAAQEVLPAVENQASQITNTINTGTNTVYRYIQNGVTKYVGITNDFERRAGEWDRARGWQIEPFPGLKENLSRFDARAVEQVLIEQTGLSNLYNQINSIATSNPIYTQAIQRGTEILRMIGHIPQ